MIVHTLGTGYIHQVRSYGRSLSYSILFSPSLEFDSSDCKKTLSDKNEVKEEEDTKRTTLANARYMWIDMDGHRVCVDQSEPFTTQQLMAHSHNASFCLWQVLSFDRMEPEALKSTLLHLLRTKDNFYLEQFEHFYNDAMKRVNIFLIICVWFFFSNIIS